MQHLVYRRRGSARPRGRPCPCWTEPPPKSFRKPFAGSPAARRWWSARRARGRPLAAEAERTARGLAGLNLRPGDRVGVLGQQLGGVDTAASGLCAGRHRAEGSTAASRQQEPGYSTSQNQCARLRYCTRRCSSDCQAFRVVKEKVDRLGNKRRLPRISLVHSSVPSTGEVLTDERSQKQ